MSELLQTRKPIPIATRVPQQLHPLNNKQVWAMSPAYHAPARVDIRHWQKEIDSIIGTTRGNESIIKLVWNGDRRFWREMFMRWDNLGQPIDATPFKRPIVRYKALRKPNGELVRDVFPPRWILLMRLEPEQFADNWAAESYLPAPEINGLKLTRPETPPSVYWLWFATVGDHNGHCCVAAEKNEEKCYGKYAPPEACLDALREHRRITELSGDVRNPFKNISKDFIRRSDEENTGYRAELARLEVEQEIFLANPLALIGLLPQMSEGMSETSARIRVKQFFDKEKDETSKLIN